MNKYLILSLTIITFSLPAIAKQHMHQDAANHKQNMHQGMHNMEDMRQGHESGRANMKNMHKNMHNMKDMPKESMHQENMHQKFNDMQSMKQKQHRSNMRNQNMGGTNPEQGRVYDFEPK